MDQTLDRGGIKIKSFKLQTQNKKQMIGFLILLLAISASIFWLFKGGHVYIKKIQSKKNKKDPFNWDQDIHRVAGRDSWDDNLHDEIF